MRPIRRLILLALLLAAAAPLAAQEPPTLRQARQRLGYAMSQIDNATRADSLQRYHIALAVEAINAALAAADSVVASKPDTIIERMDSLRLVPAADTVEAGQPLTITLLMYWPTRVDTGSIEITHAQPAVDSVYVRGSEVEIVLKDGNRGVHQGVHVKIEGGEPEPNEELALLSAGPAWVGRPAAGATWLRDGARRPTFVRASVTGAVPAITWPEAFVYAVTLVFMLVLWSALGNRPKK